MATEVDQHVLRDVFEYALDDWVSLGTVGGSLSRHRAIPDDHLCAELQHCVTALVGQGWFRPGTVEEASGFVPLTDELDAVLGGICASWDGWNDGTWWYAVWLELTNEGRAEAVRIFPDLTP